MSIPLSIDEARTRLQQLDPSVVEQAKQMMQQMSPEELSAIAHQYGLPTSVSVVGGLSVPDKAGPSQPTPSSLLQTATEEATSSTATSTSTSTLLAPSTTDLAPDLSNLDDVSQWHQRITSMSDDELIAAAKEISGLQVDPQMLARARQIVAQSSPSDLHSILQSTPVIPTAATAAAVSPGASSTSFGGPSFWPPPQQQPQQQAYLSAPPPKYAKYQQQHHPPHQQYTPQQQHRHQQHPQHPVPLPLGASMNFADPHIASAVSAMGSLAFNPTTSKDLYQHHQQSQHQTFIAPHPATASRKAKAWSGLKEDMHMAFERLPDGSMRPRKITDETFSRNVPIPPAQQVVDSDMVDEVVRRVENYRVDAMRRCADTTVNRYGPIIASSTYTPPSQASRLIESGTALDSVGRSYHTELSDTNDNSNDYSSGGNSLLAGLKSFLDCSWLPMCVTCCFKTCCVSSKKRQQQQDEKSKYQFENQNKREQQELLVAQYHHQQQQQQYQQMTYDDEHQSGYDDDYEYGGDYGGSGRSRVAGGGGSGFMGSWQRAPGGYEKLGNRVDDSD